MTVASEFATSVRDRCRAKEFNGDAGSSALMTGDNSAGSLFSQDDANEYNYASFKSRVYSVIRPIAQQIASQQINVGRLVGSGGAARQFDRPTKESLPDSCKAFQEDMEIVPDHVLIDRFREPNPVMPMWHLQYSTICSYQLTGVTYYWMPEEQGQINIWPVPSTWITPKHDKGHFAEYEINPGGFGKGITRPSEEFARFVNPDPADPFGCKSTLKAHALAVAADNAIETAQVAAFRNGIFPSHAIVLGDITDVEGANTGRPTLLKEDRDRITRSMMDMYGDVYQAGTPMILDALIKDVIDLSKSNNEMDFLDSGKATDSRISRGWGTPSAITGELENVNRAGSAVAQTHFINFTVNPLIEYMSQVLTLFVAPRFAATGERLVVWITPARPDDPENTRANYQVLAKHQACSKNEMRSALEGLGPLVDGDVIPKPMNLEDVPAVPDKSTESKRKVTRKIHLKRLKSLTADGMAGRWLKQHTKIEASYVDELSDLFVEAGSRAAQQITDLAIGKSETMSEAVAVAAAAIGGKEFDAQIMAISTEHVLGSLATGAVSELNDFEEAKAAAAFSAGDVLIELPLPIQTAIQHELTTIMMQPYWGEIAETVLTDLAGKISAGINQGMSTREIALSVQGQNGMLGRAASKHRAMRIARTEVTGALNAGHHTARADLVSQGLIRQMQWMTLMDNYTRGTHGRLNMKKTSAKGMFNVGGTKAPYPGHVGLPARERIHCRCTAVSVVDPDAVVPFAP